MVSTCAACNAATLCFCRLCAPLDQFSRERPVQSHASLRSVHRLGNAEAKRPEMLAKPQRRLPIDNWRKDGVHCTDWVEHNVRRRKGDARVETDRGRYGKRLPGSSVLL